MGFIFRRSCLNPDNHEILQSQLYYILCHEQVSLPENCLQLKSKLYYLWKQTSLGMTEAKWFGTVEKGPFWGKTWAKEESLFVLNSSKHRILQPGLIKKSVFPVHQCESNKIAWTV